MGEEKWLVSVVVPVYNAAASIDRCIESILAQTYKNFELILINDGSLDNSGSICDAYAKKDSRITVIHQKNAGVSNARNIGIDNARGDYLLFVDSDDWVESTHITNLLPESDEDLVYSGLKFYVNGKFENEHPVPAGIVLQNEWISDYSGFVGKGLSVFFINPCYNMHIIRKNNLHFSTGLQISEDGLFNLEYMKYCRKIRYSNICTYCYENGDDTSTSLSHRFQPQRMYADMQKCIKIEELTGKKELMMRWMYWQGVLRHFRKWLHFNGGEKKTEARKYMYNCYQSTYFRESIPYVRRHGTLDQKIETYFMCRFLHPMYHHVYRLLVFTSRMKSKLLKKS